ncbi:MAG: family 10 glycosylhydrolase [Cyanothece sp. SIO2G6]|nr:family 10 glycosylhydrolase [Cyanothece sp. SIO2G6]
MAKIRRFNPLPRGLIKGLRRIAIALFTLWLVIFLWQAPVVYPGLDRGDRNVATDIRGIWMTDAASALMYTSTRLDEVVANLADHHLNTLYPAVWDRGYTLYPNTVTEEAGGKRRDPLLALPLLPFQDALAGLVHQAHRQHLRLIPWFEYGFIIPASAAIAMAHPDWLTTNQAGETVLNPLEPDERLPRSLQNLQLEMVGGNWAWLNPCHPEVQQFLIDLIVDVVKRYEVDGIQLDDHFGLPVELGYDPYTITLYQQEHNGQSPPTDPTNADWMAWRAAHITALFSRIATAVRSVNPDTIISLSPNPPTFAYQKYLQNWTYWAEQGWIDEVVVQIYRDTIETFQQSLAQSKFAYLNQQIPVGIGLYTGPFADAKPIDFITQQVESIKSAGYQGVAIFSWETTLWLFKKSSESSVLQAFYRLFPLP